MRVTFQRGDDGFRPVLIAPDADSTVAAVDTPLDCSFPDGFRIQRPYATAHVRAGGWVGAGTVTQCGVDFRIEDTWRGECGSVSVERRLRAAPGHGVEGLGIRLQLTLQLRIADDGMRFCAPAMVYSPSQHATPATYLFSDSRLSYPLALGWEPATGNTVVLLRTGLPSYDTPPIRPHGGSAFRQRTDIGAVGFSTRTPAGELLACYPYLEADRSAMLDAEGTPAAAYLPVDSDGLDITVRYRIVHGHSRTFAEAVGTAFRSAYDTAPPAPVALPFALETAVDLRAASLAKTYAEWEPGGAGFLLNFDPEHGYASEPKAFGASFTTHGMTGSHRILEYGFTGRQLNAAHLLASRIGGEWVRRGRRVADFYVEEMVTPTGFLHTLYSTDKARPLYSCGDPDGPVMHYLGSSDVPGTYTRMMVEAAGDLLLCCQLYRGLGADVGRWLAACRAFGDFLLRVQQPDGSWYRAYAPDGRPLTAGHWFGGSGPDGKASTAAPVPYLLALAGVLGGVAASPYVAAAEGAGHYVLREQVARDDYRGGTLDNPNLVDKEASLMAMRALLSLYEGTGDTAWLQGAVRAAEIAVTWHFLWDVPPLPGTALARACVRSRGWGGINSVWGAGVTDIYSLFYLDCFIRLSRITGDPLYERVADIAATGCQQLLSHDGASFGFADTGMQPEGIAFCDQGVDDGLIAKGDTWGGLGWPYTAGTFGLLRYLGAKSIGTTDGPIHPTRQLDQSPATERTIP